MTDVGRTNAKRPSTFFSMPSSFFPVRLFAVALLAAGVGCAEESGLCSTSDDCALGQVCSDGMCLDSRERDHSMIDVELELDTVDGVVLGSSPRILTGAVGVDVYFLAAPCGDLVRVRPAVDDGDVRPVTITPPPEGSCYVDFDIVRDGDGVIHAVLRQKIGTDASAENAAITLEIVDDNVLSMTRFGPLPSDRRGLVPRAAVDTLGRAHAVWAQKTAGVVEIERVALPATAESATPEIATLASIPTGLALTFDAAGAAAVYALDVVTDENSNDNVERLLVAYDEVRFLTEPQSLGNIDATTCGGNLMSVYRSTSELHIGMLVPTPGAEQTPFMSDPIDSGLVRDRVGGDLAASCVNERAWIAHQSNGYLSVYTKDVSAVGAEALTIPIVEDARALDVAAAKDAAHVAWVTTRGTLGYAHIRL